MALIQLGHVVILDDGAVDDDRDVWKDDNDVEDDMKKGVDEIKKNSKVDKYDNAGTLKGDARGVAAVDDMIGYDVAVYDGYGGVGKNDRDD